MAILSVQDEFQNGDNVTAGNLNNLVNQANFTNNTTDNSTLEVHTSGYLKVKDAGVDTQHLANDAVTYAKMQDVSATDRVLGRDSAGAGNVEEITPSALRTMINVEDGATADQTGAEMKTAIGNATQSANGLMSTTDKTKLDGLVTNATHTGDVTGDTALTIANSAVTTAKIASGAVTATQIQVNAVGQAAMQNDSIGTNELINDAVTFAKMQNINTAKVIGRTTAGSGDPEEVSILDDDTMATASATSLATSESIKAYVDAQVVSVSKYASGWFNDTTGLANGGTYSFTHGLGTAEAQIQIWMATSSAGANIKLVPTHDTDGTANRGASITAISSTTLTVQLTDSGWTHLNSNGSRTNGNWGTTYTHIKVVVIG